jgi:threonine/homoserine/homoserine lactone efflux protein
VTYHQADRVLGVIDGRSLFELIIASVAIILVPGPSVMFVIARAVAWGRITAVLTALGNALGMLLLSIFIAVGLGPLLQRSELLLVIVQVLGGLYLIHLGIDAYRHRQAHADDMIKIEEIRPNNFQILRQGFTVGALNPKALVFFSAVFPQFVDAAAGSITFQLLMFGVIFAILSFLLDGMWGVLVGSSRNWFVTSKNRLVVLRTIGALVMMALGVGVIIPIVFNYLK